MLQIHPVNIPAHTLFLYSGGPIHVTFPSGLTLAEVERKNPLVVRGGRYRPPNCEARHRTAIIIPHRNREQHLKFFLYYLHPFLQRQQLNYGIYVIQQVRLQPVIVVIQFGDAKKSLELKSFSFTEKYVQFINISCWSWICILTLRRRSLSEMTANVTSLFFIIILQPIGDMTMK